MKPYFSKVLIATLFSSAVEASTTQTYWADGVSESGGWTADLQHPNQCWGAVTGNTIGWWKNNIKTPITFKENTPKDSKGISEWINKTYPNIQNGLMPYRGMEFFFAEFAPDVKLYETHNNKTYDEQFRGPTENSGGPFWTERYGYNGKLTTESLIKNFKTGKVVAALNSETHTVTLWGIEVDEATGKIRKGWITDSVYDRAGKLTMVEVTGNYDETKNMFYFAYNYSIPGTGATVLDAYYIHSVTYVSIDSERNKDISNSNETSTVNNTIPNSGTTETETNNAGTSTDETSTAETEADNKPANTEVSETANAKEVKPAEPTEPVENASDATPTVSPETVVAENTPSQPANENSSEPSVDNTAQPAVETPVVATEEAKPTAEAVAETSEQPTAVPTPEVAESAPEPTPSVASTETATVSEVKPTEPETAERLAVKSLKEAIANYQELSFVTTRVGDVTRYLIQREGIDIALIDPNSKQILVNNTGLVNYDLA
ncbi:autotransporter outer membrane beta-barrel domain-containing protein, partial [Glaesserella parasuis]|nr:autotransporter outer membrane beta-barrel domain-containing protein [Glaesserella parasuis]